MDYLCIEEGLLFNGNLISKLAPLAKRFALITSFQVEKLYGQKLLDHLRARGLDVELIAFPGGELNKTRETKHALEDQMIARGFGRDAAVIGLGGGVVTDLAGFVASTYCRGIPVVFLPTTLMGMIDASLGGKTAVNVPGAKNFIGGFHPATLVGIDITTLQTLPHPEMLCGFAEMFKHALVASEPLFQTLEHQNYTLKDLIVQNCQIKQTIFNCDPEEQGERRILNFGHTFAHALETATEYQERHGQAVALGMLFELWLSAKVAGLPFAVVERTLSSLRRLGFRFTPPQVSFSDLLTLMRRDKKASDGRPRFVLLEEIGKPLSCEGAYCAPVDTQELKQAWEFLCDAVH